MTNVSPTLLLDACVVSDMLKVDAEVVSLISQHIGPVYVPDVIVDELLKCFEIDALNELGFEVLVVPDEIKFESQRLRGQKGRHKLSENDCSCLLMASRLKYTCVSNDQELREACRAYGVPMLWELETILQLYERGAFSYERTENYIVALHESSVYITKNIVAQFRAKLDRIKREKTR